MSEKAICDVEPCAVEEGAYPCSPQFTGARNENGTYIGKCDGCLFDGRRVIVSTAVIVTEVSLWAEEAKV